MLPRSWCGQLARGKTQQKGSLDIRYTGAARFKVSDIHLVHEYCCTPKEESFPECNFSYVPYAPGSSSKQSEHTLIDGLRAGTDTSVISDSMSLPPALLEVARRYIHDTRIHRHAPAGRPALLISRRAESQTPASTGKTTTDH